MGDEILDVAAVQNVVTLPTLDEARVKIVGILRSPAQNSNDFTGAMTKSLFCQRKSKNNQGHKILWDQNHR